MKPIKRLAFTFSEHIIFTVYIYISILILNTHTQCTQVLQKSLNIIFKATYFNYKKII